MDDRDANLLGNKIAAFQTQCPDCRQEAESKMCMVNVPHFKEVMIMNLLCERCGYKSSEIKGGGAISKLGTKITLHVNDTDDMSRHVLKSDSAGISIPQLEFKLEEGGMEGVYTTVEGLLNKIYDRLHTATPFASGAANTKHDMDNVPLENHVRYNEFLEKLKDCADGRRFPFTLVISDPLSNSFVGPRETIAPSLQATTEETPTSCSDEYIDQGIVIKGYERTHEQNERLGLNDIKTENY